MAQHSKATPAALPWPIITYKGLIREHGDMRSTVAFIDLNGKHFLIKQGGKAQGLTVLNITTDSILAEWRHERRTLRRQ